MVSWLRCAALLVLAWGGQAVACSCGIALRVVPSNGSVGVPTNVALLVSGAPAGFTLSLVDGGSPQTFGPSSSLTAFERVRPQTLEPNTRYLVSASPQSEGVSGFTTGPGPDVTPPTLDNFAFTHRYVASNSSCGSAEHFLLEPQGAADDATPSFDLSFEMLTAPTRGEVNLEGTGTPIQTFFGQANCFTTFPTLRHNNLAGALVAVDWAGNRSAPTGPRHLKGCGCGSAPLGGFALAALVFLRRRAKQQP